MMCQVRIMTLNAMLRMGAARIFTLLEMLVVVTVMIVLVSLLLPALKSAKEMGYEISCAGRMRQVGVTLHLYAEDYGGKWGPQSWFSNEGLWPYAYPSVSLVTNLPMARKSQSVFHCPKDSGHPVWWRGRTYNANQSLRKAAYGVEQYTVCPNLARIKTPSKTLVFHEQYDTAGEYWALGNFYQWQNISNNHSGGTPALHYDAHVKNMKRKEWPSALSDCEFFLGL